MNEAKMQKKLIEVSDELKILKDVELAREQESSAGTDSVSSLKRELDAAVEDLHEQNVVIQMMRQRMNADQAARERAEAEIKKLKEQSAKQIEEKLMIAKDEFLRAQETIGANVTRGGRVLSSKMENVVKTEGEDRRGESVRKIF